MRIAVITNAYPPKARGGAGRIAAMQVELLRARGHEVRVWGTELEWTKYSSILRLWFHARDLWWSPTCLPEIQAWEPEIVLSHNLTGVGWQTPRRLQAHGARWAHVLHDVQLFEPSGRLHHEAPLSFLQRCITWLRRPFFGRPDLIVSPTEWLLRAHLRRGWFRGASHTIIPNPAPEATLRTSDAWQQPLRLLFVGRVSPEKGSELLLRLMTSVQRSVTWTIVGAQDEHVTLPVRENLRVLGEQDTNQVLQAMSEADVLLVLSQIAENQPTVILEALAVGLPVMTTATGGSPETLGRAGLVVPSSQVTEWVKARSTHRHLKTRLAIARRSTGREISSSTRG